MAENQNLEPGWTYKPGDEEIQEPENFSAEPPSSANQAPTEAEKLPEPVTWTASEFASNHKGANWHLSYFLFLAVFVTIVFVLTRDIISAASITLVGLLFIVVANHKPRQLPYEVNNKGVNISDKFYAYEQFKSFSLSAEGAVGCINFMPLHRFMPEISIFFPPEEGDKIINIISEHLPNNQTQEKKVDRLFKKIKF